MVIDGKKMCSHCKRMLPVEKFNKHTLNKDGLQSLCRECQVQLCKRKKAEERTLIMDIDYELAEYKFKTMMVKVRYKKQYFELMVIPEFRFGKLTRACKTEIAREIRDVLRKYYKKPPRQDEIHALIDFK